jgi:uncharacterized protein YbjT (DUF2867 family)
MRVLVTGATGYMGGYLVPRLLAEGHALRCLARTPDRLWDRPWPGVEIVRGDLEEPAAMARALEGVGVAYYLVRSRAGGRIERERDAQLAFAFGQAARRAGVRRLICLGGLGGPEAWSGRPLPSQPEVGASLAEAGVPVVEFRAGVIVGPGSAGFELVRRLAGPLPLAFAPHWVEARCQPIGLRSVLDYLAEALVRPEVRGIYEIGGTEVLSYRDMALGYARARGLRRALLASPVPPSVFGSWLFDRLTRSLPRGAGLLEGPPAGAVVRDQRALRAFSGRPGGYAEALALALGQAAEPLGRSGAPSLAARRWPRGDDLGADRSA